MTWAEFKQAAPELAEKAESLFDASGIVLVGTIRKDGSPRISPVEVLITDGNLYLGMMWQSLKALDLLRDQRCTVHSNVRDRHGTEGEFKLHGRGIDIQDAEERKRYGAALAAKIGWNPEGMNYHLFAIDVQSAGLFATEGNARIIKKWRAGELVRTYQQGMDGKLEQLT